MRIITLEELKEELEMLESDVAVFGPAGNDLARIAKLKNDIANYGTK